MAGKQLQKTISAPSLSGAVPLTLEYLILFGTGIIAILLHERLRTPLNLPGHHGLEFMALIMAGRAASRLPWASTVSSMGIGLMLLFPIFGFKDPLMGINYMFPGILADLFFARTRHFNRQLLFLALAAGLAYASVPLSRLIVHLITGYPYGAFVKHGYFIPLAGFFLFGMAGGLTGAGVTQSLLQKLYRKK